jgi:hypothetical protein
VGDEVFGALESDGGDLLQEVDELEAVTLRLEKEVQAIRLIFDIDGICVGIVFQDELFEVKERSFVDGLLSGLHHGIPGIFCFYSLAFVALHGMNHKLNHKNLLQNRRCKNLFLNGELDFQSPGMRLGPYKTSIYQLHFSESLDPLYAEGQQFS